MIRLALPLFAAGLAVLLLLAVPADPARAHNNNSAALHAETYPGIMPLLPQNIFGRDFDTKYNLKKREIPPLSVL